MAHQLGAIVEYVSQLQQVPTDGVEPLAHALPVSNVFRDDEPSPSLSVEEALANAPTAAATAGASSSSACPPCWSDLVDLTRCNAADLLALLDRGDFTSEALTSHYLAAVKRAGPVRARLPSRR